MPPPIDDRHLGRLETAADVAAAVARVWGSDLTAPGVVHVTAAWRRNDGALVPLRITEATPKSVHDRFALGVARARADAIVTSGAVLRAEPTTTHALPGDPRTAAALGAWRRETLGKRAPPLSVVLTSGRGIDWAHPFLRGPNRTYLLTGLDAAARLRPHARDLGADVVGVAEPGARAAIRFLTDRGCRTIVIETGPSAVAPLYAEPLAVGEAMLSIVSGFSPGADRLTAPLPPVERALELASRPYDVVTNDARWRFVRRVRATV